MVFDPISVVGLVGLTLGGMSFIASTAKAMEKQGREFIEYKCTLEHIHARLNLCHIQMKRWLEFWHYQEQEHCAIDRQRFFWGEYYYHIICNSLSRIEELSRKLCRGLFEELCGPNVKIDNKKQVAAWEARLEAWSRHSGNHIQTMPHGVDGRTLAQRLGLILGGMQRIEDRIARLEKEIETLEKLSKEAYGLLRGVWDITYDKVGDAINKKESEVMLLQRGFEILWSGDRSSGDWRAISLSVPAQPPLYDTTSTNLLPLSPEEQLMPISIDLVDDRVNIKPADLRQLANCSDQDTCTQVGELFKSRNTARNHINTFRSRPLRILIANYQGVSREHKKGSQTRRAVTAIGLANSVLSLWRSSWTLNPCGCRLRYVAFDDGPKVAYLGSVNDSQEICCYSIREGNRKALVLAVVLSELALCQSINVEAGSNDKLGFQIGNESKWRVRDYLLEAVHAATKSRSYKNAVAYCLELDDNRDSDEDHYTGHRTKLLHLLENYYNTVQNHYDREIARGRRRAWPNDFMGPNMVNCIA